MPTMENGKKVDLVLPRFTPAPFGRCGLKFPEDFLNYVDLATSYPLYVQTQ